mgnify:CR=1 FL=1
MFYIYCDLCLGKKVGEGEGICEGHRKVEKELSEKYLLYAIHLVKFRYFSIYALTLIKEAFWNFFGQRNLFFSRLKFPWIKKKL